MREILFKAKRIDNGKWVEGYYFYNPNIDKHFIHTWLTGGYIAVDKNTICQYTGLTDDEECKIWENDVVVYSWTDGQDEAETEETTVLYDGHGFRPFIWDYDCDGCCMYNEIIEIKVIGNIFDNPEL